jgi:hypothetical protein
MDIPGNRRLSKVICQVYALLGITAFIDRIHVISTRYGWAGKPDFSANAGAQTIDV